MSNLLLEKSLDVCETLKECLAESQTTITTHELEKTALQKENLDLKKKAQELQRSVDQQVKLVKVASSSTHVPLSKVASITDTLVDKGFMDADNQKDLQQAIHQGGVTAILETLEKVATAAIIPVSYREEGSLIKSASTTSTGGNAELLDENQQIFAKEFQIQVVK